MQHFASLQQLPRGLEFPESLKDRIRFDADKKRLYFRGFMTKAEYDQLARLGQNLEYQLAVEQLFELSAENENPQFRRVARALVVLVIVCLALAAVVWWQLLRVPRSTGNGKVAPGVRSQV